jgi:hypothetical protein
MVAPTSIYRKRDLRSAQMLLEHLRQQKGLPASLVIPDWVIARLADQLGAFGAERHEWLAQCKAEFEAELRQFRTEFDAEIARLRAILAAQEAMASARKQLQAALAMPQPLAEPTLPPASSMP